MLSLQTIITVSFAGLALSMTPGPSMFYVLSYSIGQGRAAGFASAIGLCLGGIVLAIASAFGLALIFTKFEWLATLLSILGSLYIAWLGVLMIMKAYHTSTATHEISNIAHEPLNKIMWRGVIVEILNPKTVLFFAIFLPPFVEMSSNHSDNANVILQFLILGALVPLTAIPADLIAATFGGTLASQVNQNVRIEKTLGYIAGSVLLFIALYLQI